MVTLLLGDKNSFQKNLWRGAAVLWVDVGFKLAKSGRSLLDSGQRKQPSEKHDLNCALWA
jgi:hypothetical protein